MPMGPRAPSMLMSMPNSANVSTNAPIGASDPWSTTVPAQSKITAFTCRIAVALADTQSKSSPITSSAMANDVLAPVPLEMMTMRRASIGLSTSMSRSGLDAYVPVQCSTIRGFGP
jgi:hypothetical protein